MTTQDSLDYLTVQMKRIVNGEELSSDSLDLMLYQLELLSAKDKDVSLPDITPVKDAEVMYKEVRQGQL